MHVYIIKIAYIYIYIYIYIYGEMVDFGKSDKMIKRGSVDKPNTTALVVMIHSLFKKELFLTEESSSWNQE